MAQNQGLIFIGLVLLFGIGIDHKNEIISLLKLDRHFTENDQDFKIIILPFKEYCKDNGKNYDAGLVIKNRLNGIIQKDTLKVKTWYWENFDFQDFNHQKAEEMRKYHFADMIIYGTYQTASCSAEGNQICLNFITDPKWNLSQAGFDLDKENFIQGGLDELKKGKIQEQVENIAIFVSVLAQIKNIDHKKYFAKLQGLLQKDVDSNLQGYIYQELGDHFFMDMYPKEALGSYRKAVRIYEKDNDTSQLKLLQFKVSIAADFKDRLDNFELDKEIYHKNPDTLSKDLLAGSIQMIGSFYFKLNFLDKACEFFEEGCQLEQELYEAYPSNKKFRNNLALFYFSLYQTNLRMGKKIQAKKYLVQNIKLYEKLAKDFPTYPNFKRRVEKSIKKLEELEK